jgi:hypothetical protein
MEIVGYILAGVFGIAAAFMFQVLGKLAQENSQIKQELLKYQSMDYAYRISSLLASKTPAKPKLQKQTEQLLVLAIRSNNENEARAAAVQACKRISKELEIK